MMATVLRFSPHPDRLAGDRAGFVLDLAPGVSRVLYVAILCDHPRVDGPVGRLFARALRDQRRSLRRHDVRAVAITTSTGFELHVDGDWRTRKCTGMTLVGPVKTVFEGTIDLDDLSLDLEPK